MDGNNSPEKTVDVVIVGAGMSGLAAADAIQQTLNMLGGANKDALRFVVLEGSERVGGRVLTVADNQGHLDVGGQYLGPTQTYSNLLVERFQLKKFKTWLPADKHSIYQAKSGRLSFFFRDYPLTDDVLTALATIETLVSLVKASICEPWRAPAAKYLDRQSVADWAGATFDSEFGKELMGVAIRSAFSVEPSEISMLYLLYYAATCGSFRAFMNVNGGGDAYRLYDGMGCMSNALQAAIGKDKIVFGKKVERIEQDETEARVYAAGDPVPWVAKRVIMAMSPVVSGNGIAYDPPLDPGRVKLCQGAPMAQTIKGFLRYEKAWWRTDFSGYALSARGPACWIMDNTWQNPESDVAEFPALMTFIAGQPARDWNKRTKDERQQELEKQVKSLFGWNRDKVPAAISYFEQDWADDEFARGGPAGCLGPNVLTQYGEHLRVQSGLIHWAGSETATEWAGGYVNGALQAGIRAAGEVVDELLIEPAMNLQLAAAARK